MRRFVSILMIFWAAGYMGLTRGAWKGPGIATAAVDEREALLKADRDFDKATAERGIDGWVSFFAEDGAMFPDRQNIVTGKDAIRRLMTPTLVPGSSLRWQPTRAEVARSGDLGYTYGASTFKSIDAEGKPLTRYGKYVTIWKKQADGSWKVALDIGNSAPPSDINK